MPEEITTSDGKVITLDNNTLTLPDGKKYVLESDLLAVKKGHEKQLSDLQEASTIALNDAKGKADEHYQNLLSERTAKEQLESRVKELEPLQSKVTEYEAQIKTAGESSEQLNTKLLGLKKDYMKTVYKLTDANSLEGKTLTELETLESALKLVGPKDGKGYDTGGGGGGSTDSTPFAVELAEIAEAKERAGVKDE